MPLYSIRSFSLMECRTVGLRLSMAKAKTPSRRKPKAGSRSSGRNRPKVATLKIVDADVAGALGPAFREMEGHPNPQKRGSEFELLLQRLFRLSGYDAARNPAIARPRQTDLLARLSDTLFLVEAKWQDDPADIDVLDGLHARLRRAPRGTIGCCFSMSSFTRNAIERAQELRRAEHGHEVVLFDQLEIAAMMNGSMELTRAMRAKQSALRERGEILFLRDNPGIPRLVPLDIPFPRPRMRRTNDLEQEFEGSVYNFAFGELPSSFEAYNRETHGFQLFGPARVDTVGDLKSLLELIHSRLRLGEEGGYTITELGNAKTWLGTSAERFIKNLGAMKARHVGACLKETHHSEEFTYYDSTRLGALLICGRQNISTERLYGVSFELRLPGIPIDPEPLRSIANAMGLEDEQLVPVDRGWIKRVDIPRDTNELLLEPLEYLRSAHDPQYIAGAVVRNPFFSQDVGSDPTVGILRTTSVLLGRVGDHLAEDERVRRFRLRRLNIAEFRMGHVVDVFMGHDEDLRYRISEGEVVDRGQPILSQHVG